MNENNLNKKMVHNTILFIKTKGHFFEKGHYFLTISEIYFEENV